MKNVAVVSAKGLGDGLISMVVSQNLLLAGVNVTTFNPWLHQLARWFPGHKFAPLPKLHDLSSFDLIVSPGSFRGIG